MYAQILLNQKYSNLGKTFTYAIPEGMDIKKGSLVIVPYGKNKLGGIVLELTDVKPEFKTREILKINEIYPQMPSWQFEIAEFISNYYISSIYKSFKLFLPNKIWDERGKFTNSKKSTDEKGTASLSVTAPKIKMTKEQKGALASMLNDSTNKFLIHGVTGSGKTEIYLQFAHCLAKQDKQTLILIPEISLTPQTENYFKKIFKNRTAIIHSNLTESKRTTEWLKIASGTASVIIGSRSSIFAPFKNLGAIIIDEEHDLSYKQDQSPRYDTRMVAEKIAELTNAKLILGSATPSVETFYKAQKGEYKLLELPERIGSTPLPEVKIIDMREELRAGNFGIFSTELEEKLTQLLKDHRQAILFLNRRGTASSITCRNCGYSPECKNCSVKMTYHSSIKTGKNILVCHHCGDKQFTPIACPTCGSMYIKNMGLGTERVEQEICTLFPEAKVLRADKDTVKTRDDFPLIYKKFHAHEADILIGTQMISKGLDIEHVDLVAVIMADIGLHIPDFRSQEFIFSTLSQVSGRAGRREKQGSVIIQTYVPDNSALKAVKDHNYKLMYKTEMESRKKLNLPPFYKIIKLTYTDPDFEKAKQRALNAQKKLETKNIETSSAPALISRKHGKYHYNLFLKAQEFDKEILRKIKEMSDSDENMRVDIDPLITI
ncbi:MAG: primosomal protein N' [Candidatus Gracilibacteria bacterium]|jgi:primosomal protein N' (replication factor Y)